MQPKLSGCLDTAINIRAGTSPKRFSFKHTPFTQMPTRQSSLFENLPLNNRWMCPSSIKEQLIKPISAHSAGKQPDMCPSWVASSAVHLWDPWAPLWGGGNGQGAFAGPLTLVWGLLITHLPPLRKRTRESVCGKGESRANALPERHWNLSVLPKAAKNEEGNNTFPRNWLCWSVKIPVKASRQG